MSINPKRSPQIFLAVLMVSVIVSLWLRFQLNFNAGHMDEYDYLFVGKRLLAGASWPSHAYIFGSDFNWYLLGLGDQWFGGLSGARMVAAAFGLLSLVGIYCFVYSLWQRHLTACIAVALLSIQSIQLFISRFATYDIISFACFSLSLAPLLLACTKQGRAKYSYLLLAIVLMSLAISSKYVVILYLPLVAGLAFLYSRLIGFLFGAAVGLILLGYAIIHWESLHVLYNVQIQGVHGVSNGSLQYILNALFNYLGLLLLGWLLAILWSVKLHPKSFWKQVSFQQLLLLLLLALPMAAYHLNALNMISLFKHLVYASLFLVPAAAWLLTNFLDYSHNNWLKQIVASSFVVGMCVLNFQQLKAMESAYADVNSIIQQAESKLNAEDTILSEDPYLFRYLGEAKVPQVQIKESGWLDNNQDGKHDTQDVVDAIWDLKFSYVFLNDQLHPELNKKLRKVLSLKNYKLLVDEEYHISNVMSRQTQGRLSLYQRTQAPQLSLLDDALFTEVIGSQRNKPRSQHVD